MHLFFWCTWWAILKLWLSPPLPFLDDCVLSHPEKALHNKHLCEMTRCFSMSHVEWTHEILLPKMRCVSTSWGICGSWKLYLLINNMIIDQKALNYKTKSLIHGEITLVQLQHLTENSYPNNVSGHSSRILWLNIFQRIWFFKMFLQIPVYILKKKKTLSWLHLFYIL